MFQKAVLSLSSDSKWVVYCLMVFNFGYWLVNWSVKLSCDVIVSDVIHLSGWRERLRSKVFGNGCQLTFFVITVVCGSRLPLAAHTSSLLIHWSCWCSHYQRSIMGCSLRLCYQESQQKTLHPRKVECIRMILLLCTVHLSELHLNMQPLL